MAKPFNIGQILVARLPILEVPQGTPVVICDITKGLTGHLHYRVVSDNALYAVTHNELQKWFIRPSHIPSEAAQHTIPVSKEKLQLTS